MVKCTGCGEDNPPKFRLCGYCGTPLPAAAPAAPALPAHEVRKTVTLLFCDLKGSTALGETLDPEALHEVKERYFKAMAAEIERHGGKIEKYIGDAIMAVFGLPRAHEDDALRAVRAADGMRQALAQVNLDLQTRYGVTLANRTGVNTGEVVANDDPGADQKLATGDAVNVCARLEQAAPENEVYLGDVTYRLVRDAVHAVPVAPLTLKGKTEPVPAWQLVQVHGQDGHIRRHDTPLVGREPELAALRRVVDEVRSGGQPRLVTVIGDAGVGKTRLVHEVMHTLAAGSRLLSGRCLPYGEDITFWPLLLIVREAAAIDEQDSPAEALAKLQACAGDTDVADRLASVCGLSRAAFPLADIYWAARKFLARQAALGPLLVFVDDIHWAAPAFLDLLNQLLDSDALGAVLMLATSRHDLLEQRPDWGQQRGALRLVLQPLDSAATAQVVADRLGPSGLPPDLVQRIVDSSEGNPLYVEQMLSMLIDSGALKREGERWVAVEGATTPAVPPTIQALLEARLDQLARAERVTVEPAAVIGLEFGSAAVAALAPAAVQPTLPAHLDTLARKQFIRAAHSATLDTSFRFAHHLVRETVYNGLLKRARANLHLAFVRWADRHNADVDQALTYEAILGYHLEQAYGYLRELGSLDEEGRAIGADAAKRLSSAGGRAAARGDTHAAASLLRRAVALLERDNPRRTALLPELGEALMGVGDFAGARAVLDEALAAATAAGDLRGIAASRVGSAWLALYSGQPGENWGEDTLRMAQSLIPALEAQALHNEAAMAWRLCVMVHGIAGRYSEVDAAVAPSIHHARLAGNERLVARNSSVLLQSALYGPLPVSEALPLCEKLLAAGISDRQVEGVALCVLAQLRAMNGELEPARALYRRSRTLLHDLGHGVFAASTGIHLARVELRGGDLHLAESELRRDHDFLAAKGETYFRSTIAALLARVLRELERDEEALAFTRTAEQISAADDTESNALWRAVRATLLARAGDLAAAERLASEATELVRPTESPLLKAEVFADLATVLRMADRSDEARAATDEAVAHYRSKGDAVQAARLHAMALGQR
jgi:class 3 adenylate cyclase/tetratricopeptide (TPR) repeat protein